jgi:hypothetical protein
MRGAACTPAAAAPDNSQPEIRNTNMHPCCDGAQPRSIRWHAPRCTRQFDNICAGAAPRASHAPAAKFLINSPNQILWS